VAEKFAEKFESSMKNGFIASLILIVIEKNPSYGYKIAKEIEKRTLGLWDIPSSTMYTVLKDMTEKQLITFREEQVEGRNRKVYETTSKGQSTLRIMLEKKSLIESSFEALRTAMLGEDKVALPENMRKLHPLNLILKRLDERSEREQLDFLKVQRSIITRNIERHKEQVQRIDERIEVLNRKIERIE
jgi:PadR family transcriptional regulator, regulatory protein PadR